MLTGAAAGHTDARATTIFKSTDGGAALMKYVSSDESGNEGDDEYERDEDDRHLPHARACAPIAGTTDEVSTRFGLKEKDVLAGAAAGHIDARATTTFKSTEGGAALMTIFESGDEGFGKEEDVDVEHGGDWHAAEKKVSNGIHHFVRSTAASAQRGENMTITSHVRCHVKPQRTLGSRMRAH